MWRKICLKPVSCPCTFGAGGLHGRKDSCHIRLARPVGGAAPAFRAFFVLLPEQGAEN